MGILLQHFLCVFDMFLISQNVILKSSVLYYWK